MLLLFFGLLDNKCSDEARTFSIHFGLLFVLTSMRVVCMQCVTGSTCLSRTSSASTCVLKGFGYLRQNAIVVCSNGVLHDWL